MNAPAPKIWSEALTIHSYDVDFRRQLTLEALCRYFLEAAWNHAEALGFGFSHLAKDNKVWVLSRLLLAVDRFPAWGDGIVLETWPRGTESVFALRDFELLQKAGGRVAGGSAGWLIIDAKSRRPQRVEKYLTPITPIARRATERDPGKITLPSGRGLECAHPRVQQSPSSDHRPIGTETSSRRPGTGAIRVRYSDVDLNGHVNSARYLGWFIDTYDWAWHENHTPKQVEVNYLSETRDGEMLSITTDQVSPMEFVHAILKTDGQEACRARIEWREG